MEGEVVGSRPTECKYAYHSNIKKKKKLKKEKKDEKKKDYGKAINKEFSG